MGRLSDVIVDKRLVDTLRKKSRQVTKSYVIGKNPNGVVVKAIRLKKTGGCQIMPATDEQNIALATMKLWEKNLVPCGFMKVGTKATKDFSGYGVDCLGKYKGNAFCVSINKTGITTIAYQASNGKIINRTWRVIQYTK